VLSVQTLKASKQKKARFKKKNVNGQKAKNRIKVSAQLKK